MDKNILMYEIENQATILNNYAQVLHYAIEEMEHGRYKLPKDREPTLDDEYARVPTTCTFVLEGLQAVRDDLYKLWDNL